MAILQGLDVAKLDDCDVAFRSHYVELDTKNLR